MNRYLDKGHRLFLDNYYMSPILDQYLLHCQTKVVGAVSPTRRNFPRELAAAGIDKGESNFLAAHTGMLAVKFRTLQDKSNKKPKIVHMLMTDHSNHCVDTGKKTRDGTPVIKPQCITDYNRYMDGVDVVDQQLESVLAIRRIFK